MLRIKNTIATLQTHRHYDKAMYWGKAISITGIAQILVQAVGFISGILVIRLLPVQEYALYTLANTMLGTMTVLADGGISTGVMAQGGKVWQDREKLGAVLATGLDLRKKFAIGSLIVSTPILLYLLLHNGASWLMALLIVLSLIPAFYAGLSDSLLQIVPKLHQSILPLQKNQVTVGIGRLLLTALTLFVFPWTFVAILAGGIPRIYGNIKLKKITNGFVDKFQETDNKVRNEVLLIVKRTLPQNIYYCLSGQITIWLISIFGTSTALAGLGALGRLGMVLNLFTVLFAILIVPRFSKLPEIKAILNKNAILILVTSLILSLLVITFTWFFASPILWIIGANYSNLHNELVLSIVGNCIYLIFGFFYSVNLSRGWAINPIPYILISIITTIIAAIYINISTIEGILFFNIIVSSIQMIMLITYSFYKISKIRVYNLEVIY